LTVSETVKILIAKKKVQVQAASPALGGAQIPGNIVPVVAVGVFRQPTHAFGYRWHGTDEG